MKRVTIIKTIVENLIAASVCALVVAASFALPYVNAASAPGSAAGPAPYSEPCKGAGRDAAAADEANGQLTIDNGQLRNEESEVETEAVGANGQLTMSPHPSAEPTPSPQGEGFDQGEGLIEVLPEREDPPETELDALIREAAERYGLSWELVSAVVWAESRYDPNAVSGTPDYGLMQITESVLGAYGLTADNWMDPAANLDAGCQILREKIDEGGGDLTIALMKYNEGDAGYLENIAAGIWSTKYTEDVLGKYYQILREGKR